MIWIFYTHVKKEINIDNSYVLWKVNVHAQAVKMFLDKENSQFHIINKSSGALKIYKLKTKKKKEEERVHKKIF